MSPRGTLSITGEEPVSYARYPSGNTPSTEEPRRGVVVRELVRRACEGYEFLRLWPQTIYGLWWLITDYPTDERV